jgi:hypothetical protein
MNADMRALLREGILVGLDRSGEYRPTLETLHLGLRQSGHQASRDEVQTELRYLIDKGFVAPEEKAISPERTRFRIAADGRDYLAKEGLA